MHRSVSGRAAADWIRVDVKCGSEDLAPLAAARLIELGGGAVEQDGNRLSTYLPMPNESDPARAIAGRVTAALDGVPGVDASSIEVFRVAARDWVAEWRAGLGPRRVGRRFIVAPSWSAPAAGSSDLVLRIDPQMAFGTAEHASTRGVLRLLERAVTADDVVLDVGTGSGILAIAAARLGAARVHAADSDADALINARENVAANGVADRVRLEHAAVDAGYLVASGVPFDVIAANVLSGVLVPLLPAFAMSLAPAGALLLGGIVVDEADTVLAAAAAAGLVPHATDREEGWWSGWFVNRRVASRGDRAGGEAHPPA